MSRAKHLGVRWTTTHPLAGYEQNKTFFFFFLIYVPLIPATKGLASDVMWLKRLVITKNCLEC